MINRTHALFVVRQYQILGLSRSTAYYKPAPVSAADLVLMRQIDARHREYLFAGVRMLRDLLRNDGYLSGRRHVATLMRRMGLEAVYRKPRTSQRHPAHTVYPYLLRNAEDHPPEPCLGGRYHLHPDTAARRSRRPWLAMAHWRSSTPTRGVSSRVC